MKFSVYYFNFGLNILMFATCMYKRTYIYYNFTQTLITCLPTLLSQFYRKCLKKNENVRYRILFFQSLWCLQYLVLKWTLNISESNWVNSIRRQIYIYRHQYSPTLLYYKIYGYLKTSKFNFELNAIVWLVNNTTN